MRGGFSLIEIMLVLMIIGILFQYGLPRIFRVGTSVVEQFARNLTSLTHQGLGEAIEKQDIQKIRFNIQARHVDLINTKTNKNLSRIEIPKDLEVTDFFINNKSQFYAGSQKETAFFFINTDGTMQRVRLSVYDTVKQLNYSLILNPFTGRFTIDI